VQFKTAAGKDETLVTVQVDFHLPAQFELEYITADGGKARPIMVHRGVLSTMERMVALLIEEYKGNFPVWLAPTQAIVLPVADRNNEYAEEIAAKLRKHKIRVEVDARSERVPAKVRDAKLRKIPYLLVVGDKDAAANAVSVNVRGAAGTNGRGDIGAMPVDEFISKLVAERDTKALKLMAE
jgi:threonyl-tRNA synthetase